MKFSTPNNQIQSNPKNVLVYSMGESIGDGIFKIPFIRALRRRFPNAYLTWFTGGGRTVYAGVLNPVVAGFLDEVISADAPEERLDGTFWDLVKPRRPLPGKYFDLIIDTQTIVIRSLILRKIRHHIFVSGAARFLLSDVKPPRAYQRPKAMLQRMQDLLDLAQPAPEGAEAPDNTPIVSEEFANVARVLLPDGPEYVGISPGAGLRSKCWPLDRFVALAKVQAEAGRTPVFFLGPGEEEWLEQIRGQVPGARFPEWNRSDEFTQTKGPILAMALAGRLRAAVANDSGGGHILAAGGVALVSLFGRHDPEKYQPAAAVLRVIDAKDYGGKEMDRIPLARVVDELEDLLALAEQIK